MRNNTPRKTMSVLSKTLLLLSAAIFLGTGTALAQVPHTFSANSPAKAAEVNANFQALVDGINAINLAATPLDSSYSGWQYSSTATAGSKNVIVLRAIDPIDDTQSFYLVRVSYQNGSVDVNGTPTTFTYVRKNARLIAIGSTVSLAANRKEGTNDIELSGNSLWKSQWIEYELGTAVVVVNGNQGERRFRCHNPAVSGMVRNCWRRTSDPSGIDPAAGSQTMIVNRSRIASVTSGSFNAGALTFPNGGAVQSYLSNAISLNFSRVARNVGVVLETRTKAGTTNDQTAHFIVIYYRIEGVDGGNGVGMAVGSLVGTPLEATKTFSGVFFTE